MIALTRRTRPKRRMTKTKRSPTLRLTPYAWAKLIFMRDVGGTEIGAFGISHASDLLLVEDIVMVRQFCTPVTVQFADDAVADYFDDQVDAGRKPEQFSRIWLHTHPGDCPRPSGTDEETFRRCFGQTDWAVMFIVAQGGATYGRLRFNAGPGVDTPLRRAIDYTVPFPAADQERWLAEYEDTVEAVDPFEGFSDPFFADEFPHRPFGQLRCDSECVASEWVAS
jgi:proteasome lid subunit RPN8/RPN11